MPLTALKEPSRNYAGGVRFAMMNGPTRVACWVTREALNRAEHRNSSQQDQIRRFDGTASELSSSPAKNMNAGEQAPIVMSFDLAAVLPSN